MWGGAAAARFVTVGVPHAITTLLGSALLDQLTDLAVRATGDPALAMDLATGYGAMEETALIEDLWAASRGSLQLTELIRRHGYHGPDEGDLSSRTWREDPAPLESVLRNYRKQDLASPREREERQGQRRAVAEERLLAGLPRARRPRARLVMKLASTYIPLREIGKASFLHALDGGRCAARAGAPHLIEAGVLEDPEDVFFLTFDEFLAAPDPALREVVAERKERHARYLGLTLPPSWQGQPEPVPLTPGAQAGEDDATALAGGAPRALRGIGVTGGLVTGRARVVHDPLDADLDEGDILVCRTTDPSWTPLFMLAEALVIDTGGAMSHGAIVARELGVTCVINTVTGTRDIPDGATITVDGATGAIEISGAPAPAPPVAG
jgi:pyruvate,water dikinase